MSEHPCCNCDYTPEKGHALTCPLSHGYQRFCQRQREGEPDPRRHFTPEQEQDRRHFKPVRRR